MNHRKFSICAGFMSPLMRSLLLCLALLPFAGAAEAMAKVAFDIPAGAAAETLKRAAQQARLEIAFPAETVRGVNTRAVRGDFSPAEAMNLMLVGSGLAMVKDEKTGALTVRRLVKATGEEGAAQRKESALPKKMTLSASTQTASAAGETAGEVASQVLEAVVITGKVSINSTPEEIKRLNVAIVDSMTAEQIGQLPDASLAEVMDRIVGVSSDLGFNSSQPRTVTMRGFDARYNSMQVDGNPIWNSSRNNRGTQLDVFPAAAVSEVNAFKTTTPDQDANSIGGHIELRTLRAFDGGTQPFTRASVSVGASEQDGVPDSNLLPVRVSAVTRKSFGTNQRIGVVFGGDYLREHFYDVYNTNTGFSQIGGIDVVNGSIFTGLGDKDSTRQSLYGKLEFRTQDQLYAFVSLSYFRAINDEHYYRGGPFLTATTVTNASVGSGTFARATNENYLESYTLDRTTWLLGSGLDYRVGGNAVLKLRSSYTRYIHDEVLATGERFQTAAVTAGTYKLNDTDGGLALNSDAAISDPKNWNYRVARAAVVTNLPNTDDVYTLRTDYNLNSYASARGLGFNTGLFWRRLDRRFDNTGESYLLPAGTVLTLAQVLNPKAPQVLDGVNPAIIAPDAYWNLLKTKGTRTANPALSSDYHLVEDVYAAHAAFTYARENWRLMAGARVEETRLTNSTGNVVNSVNTPVTRELTYRNTLPNVQASYDLTPRLRLRAAFTKTLARPDFNQFAMGQTETRDANGFPVITGTNPDLPPRLASGYDLSAEYNFKDGYASVGLFHKDLDNESFNQTTRDTNPAGNVIFTRTIPLGSGSGTLRGFEASWVKRRFSELPAPFNGLGLEANFTRLDGEWNVVFANGTRRTVDGLRNQPRWLGSIIPSYTIGRFELRAPWRLRGKTFTGTFGTTAAGDVYVRTYARLDLQATYKLNRTWKLFAECRNANETFWTQETGLNGSTTAAVNPGRSFWLGVKYQK
jgi:TonB-dependent receptor